MFAVLKKIIVFPFPITHIIKTVRVRAHATKSNDRYGVIERGMADDKGSKTM